SPVSSRRDLTSAWISITLAGYLVTAAASSPAPQRGNEFAGDLPVVRRADHVKAADTVRPFATYAQCQIELLIGGDPNTSLPVVSDDNAESISDCLAVAVREEANVVILPELALAF